MTFTNKNKSFKYTVTLDVAQNVFKAYLVDDFTIFGTGVTIEKAVRDLEDQV